MIIKVRAMSYFTDSIHKTVSSSLNSFEIAHKMANICKKKMKFLSFCIIIHIPPPPLYQTN